MDPETFNFGSCPELFSLSLHMPQPPASSEKPKTAFFATGECADLKVEYYNCGIEKFCSNTKFLRLGELVRQCEEATSKK